MFAVPSLIFLLYLSGLAASFQRFDARDMGHMRSHLRGTIDFSNLSQRELLFHYFQLHDVEGDNKLDGCEILQSVLHMYFEASARNGVPMKVFSDSELAGIVDPFLERNDKNQDGLVDYAEFLNGEMSRTF